MFRPVVETSCISTPIPLPEPIPVTDEEWIKFIADILVSNLS